MPLATSRKTIEMVLNAEGNDDNQLDFFFVSVLTKKYK